MQIFLPEPPERYDGMVLRRLTEVLRRAFNTVISSDQAAPRVLLRAPGGKIYSVTVDDAGALQVAQAAKTQP